MTEQSKNKGAAILVQLTDLLEPLTSEERQRVVSAALMFLGETPIASARLAANDESVTGDEDGDLKLSLRAKTWLKQNGLSFSELQQVFHFDGENVEIIVGDVPGANAKEKSLSAYILLGAKALLMKGTPDFDDNSARELCRNFGCFNQGNHSNYLKEKGNDLAGSKERGWSLTAPGLKRAASIIKEFTPNK